jgi:predicted Zn-dependent peptidase
MNSRLNLNIREKFGLTYNINSFYAPFLDSGIWGIYYSCEPGNLRRIRRLVYKELKTLRNNKLGVMRLSQAKKQLIGQLTLAGEYPMAQMMSMAKDLLDFDRIVRFDEAIRDIESISEADIMDAANEMASEECLSRISYLPDEPDA